MALYGGPCQVTSPVFGGVPDVCLCLLSSIHKKVISKKDSNKQRCLYYIHVHTLSPLVDEYDCFL